jgi:glc operon protein GlcG
MLPMISNIFLALASFGFLSSTLPVAAADLPQKRYLNLAAIKTMAAAVEAEAAKRNVQVTFCIMDENANVLFLQKADGAGTKYNSVRATESTTLCDLPSAFQGIGGPFEGRRSFRSFDARRLSESGGIPIRVEGIVIGSIGVSGAASEVDEAIGQAAIDALLKN